MTLATFRSSFDGAAYDLSFVRVLGEPRGKTSPCTIRIGRESGSDHAFDSSNENDAVGAKARVAALLHELIFTERDLGYHPTQQTTSLGGSSRNLGRILMRLIRFAPAAMSLLLAAPCALFAQQPQQGQPQGQGQGRGQAQQQPQPPVPPSDYGTFVSREDFFSVHVPCKFETRDITWNTEYGSVVPGRVYSCNRGTENYSMTVINYTDIERIHKGRHDPNSADIPDLYWRIDLSGSIAYAATRLRQKATKVTFDSFQLIDLIPGHQLQFTNPNGTRTFAGIYLHQYRLYILEATAPPTAAPPGLFQQSLSVLNAEGTRIRYPTSAPYRHPW
jgi:hypothetical protein